VIEAKWPTTIGPAASLFDARAATSGDRLSHELLSASARTNAQRPSLPRRATPACLARNLPSCQLLLALRERAVLAWLRLSHRVTRRWAGWPANMADTARSDVTGTQRATGTHASRKPHGQELAALSLAALGVVYGDIGTSPLYAMSECLSPSKEHAIKPGADG